jgi:mannose-6-phosphate isomerase-like protein (cupin superfamily)
VGSTCHPWGDLAINSPSESTAIAPAKGYEVADFQRIEPVACPCGWARRAFGDIDDFPGTIHVTEISSEARTHYHRRLTETYYFLECGPGAQMQLDSDVIDVHPGMCVMIRPGVRHRALGKMKVLIMVLPKFDPEDEWFD